MQTNNSKEKVRQLQNKLYLTAKQKSHEENESRSQEECKQTKSASCKGRGFNKESESENHRMEELLFHQEKRKVDAGSRLVHYLHFYKMV